MVAAAGSAPQCRGAARAVPVPQTAVCGPPVPCLPLGMARHPVAYCEPAAVATPKPGEPPCCLPAPSCDTLVPMLALVLLLSSCIMPSRQDATPALSLAEPPMAAPVPEPTAEDRAAVVNRNANVRPGPDTNHALPEGTASEPQTAEPTESRTEAASEAEVPTVTVTGCCGERAGRSEPASCGSGSRSGRGRPCR